MQCPKCNSENVFTQSFQENNSRTITKTKEKRHGFLWWITIGWLWILVKLMFWIFAFPIMAVLHIGRKRDYVSKSQTINKIHYKTVCTCQNCGYTWKN